MNKLIQPTDEQEKFLGANGNVVITAKPGSGKTFTIIEKIVEISETLLEFQGVIAISFTRKASQELELRYKRKNSTHNGHFFGTIDKFYISEIIIPFARLLTGKLSTLEIKSSFRDYPEYEDLRNIGSNMNNQKFVNLLIKSLKEGHIFLDICGETAFYILCNVPQCLLYLKARYTHIFIDEYQDCGEIQHKIFKMLVSEGIVGVAVGDMDQAIFAFTDRYSTYLLELINDNSFKHLELTLNHRCHASISDYSLAIMGVPKVPAKDMRVSKIKVAGSEKNIIQAIEQRLDKIKTKYNISKNSDIAILCRGTATAKSASEYLNVENKLFVDTPLDRVNATWAILFNNLLSSFYLYKVNEMTSIDFVSIYISEDLNYRNFLKGLEIVNEIFNLDEDKLKHNLSTFVKFAKLVFPEYEDSDIISLLHSILSNKDVLNNFKPATDNEINIMTLHKSKGLEFKCVFLLDLYKYIFPRENINQEDYTQDLNLYYVGVTRAIETCYIMQGSKRYRPRHYDYWNAEESPFLLLNNTINLRNNRVWK